MTTVPAVPSPTRSAAQPTDPPAGLSGAALRRATADAVTRAQEWLLAQQSPEGWWKGELETNVTMDAEDLLMRHVLGILTPQQAEETARWIRSQQRSDGTWATWYDGPADLSTTVESYAALRLAGDRADEPHLLSAAKFIREQGGLPATRVFTRIWLAMVGLWSWDELPVLPPELVLLPKRFPLALPQWGCWARQTIVPLAIVSALRPSTPVSFDLEELSASTVPPTTRKLSGFDRFFLGLDKVLHRYERWPIRPLRRHAMRAAAEWIIARQEADGSWGGIQPPWVYSVIALRLMGYPLEHPVLAAGLAGLERFTIREETPAGVVRRLEACQSPVWDTALALVALGDSGMPADNEAMRRAGHWLLDEEVTVRGDWAVQRPHLAPGGWAFEFDNDLYPDVDDTAEVVLALRKVSGLDDTVDLVVGKSGDAEGAIRRAVDWVLGMQCADGGWAAFDADQTGRMPTRLPFCDFGEVIDPPSADVTAHAVEMLVAEGLGNTQAVRRGVQWLLDHQEHDGSWFGRWGVNHVYGTGAVVPALVDAGVPADGPALQSAVRWLLEHQQPEGGWGEDIRSYLNPQTVGEGPLTASQTGWALLALLAVVEHAPTPQLTAAIERGISWLIATQQPDGSWDEPYYTGTGFPGDFSINYHLYRQVFPLTALGRFAGNRHLPGRHAQRGRSLGRDR